MEILRPGVRSPGCWWEPRSINHTGVDPTGERGRRTVILAVGLWGEAPWATERDCVPVFIAQAASSLMGILGGWFWYITYS